MSGMLVPIVKGEKYQPVHGSLSSIQMNTTNTKSVADVKKLASDLWLPIPKKGIQLRGEAYLGQALTAKSRNTNTANTMVKMKVQRIILECQNHHLDGQNRRCSSWNEQLKKQPAPGGEANGAYGTRFWHEVAGGVPGRTPAQCLDGYVASHYAIVARFSSSGRRRTG
jgi:hypothetical protein